MSPKKENFSMQPSKKKGDSKVKIQFEKELTIYTIESFKKEMASAIKKYKNIELVISNVDNIDLTFIQLIDSFKKTAEKKKINVSYKVKLEGENKILLDNSGFSDFFSN